MVHRQACQNPSKIENLIKFVIFDTMTLFDTLVSDAENW